MRLTVLPFQKVRNDGVGQGQAAWELLAQSPWALEWVRRPRRGGR
ncbi:MAG: hypothetical protein ABSF83_12610 [Nitrososphaerales archaeon]